MLFSDLALILTIMINTLILHQSSEAGIMADRGQPNSYPQGVLKHFNCLDVNDKLQRFPGKNGRANKTTKMRQRKCFLCPIRSGLTVAINKYEGRRSLIETIYSMVLECGRNKCEKFQGLIPENQLMGHVKCFRDNFKKMILNKLLKFHRGVRIIEKTFQKLINFEDKFRFNNESRRALLNELKINMKVLNDKTETVLVNKIPNFSRQPENFTSYTDSLPQPAYETHLIINEWRIIQDSQKFLRDWQQNFEKIFKCWEKRQKKRKRKKALALENSNQPHRPPTPNQILRNSRRKKKPETILSGDERGKFPTFPFQTNNS